MNTHRLHSVIPLVRPWHQRLREALWARWFAWQARRAQTRAWRQARELSARTLEDIGAPDELQAEASQSRASQQMTRELLRAGIVSRSTW
jgi:hypothetical protein